MILRKGFSGGVDVWNRFFFFFFFVWFFFSPLTNLTHKKVWTNKTWIEVIHKISLFRKRVFSCDEIAAFQVFFECLFLILKCRYLDQIFISFCPFSHLSSPSSRISSLLLPSKLKKKVQKKTK